MTRPTRPAALHPFYPIVDDPRWLRRILPLGVRLVQLRVKDRAGAGLRDVIAESLALCDAHDTTLVVNDHWAEAIALGATWVHLGQEDLDGADLAAIRAADIRIGVSTHDHAELERALAVGADYVALGPVHPTILKVMPWAPQGLGRVGEWKRLVGDRSLVAIGGMRPDRGIAALAAGADVVSAVTDITLAPDPEARVREWLQTLAISPGVSRSTAPGTDG